MTNKNNKNNKIISLGLNLNLNMNMNMNMTLKYQCESPFDRLWCPSKTTYDILYILIHYGVEQTIYYMTSGHTYYKSINGHYISTHTITENQMNRETGLGNSYYVMNNAYKQNLKINLERFLIDISKEDNDILFIYADAPNPAFNYYLDNVNYGVDATEYLLKIHDLISIKSINKKIFIFYFCWKEREKNINNDNKIKYIPFTFKNNWDELNEFIQKSLINSQTLTLDSSFSIK